MRFRKFVLVIPFVFIFGASKAVPQTIKWLNSSGGSWMEASNWDPPQLPGPADDVQITLDNTYEVSLDGSVNIASLTLGGTSGTQTLVIDSMDTLRTTGEIRIGSSGHFDVSGNTAIEGDTLIIDGSLNVNFFKSGNVLFNIEIQNRRSFFIDGGETTFAGQFHNQTDADFGIRGGSITVRFLDKFTNSSVFDLSSFIEINPHFYIIEDTLINDANGIINVTKGVNSFQSIHRFTIIAGGLFDNRGTINVVDEDLDIENQQASFQNSGRFNITGGNLRLRGQQGTKSDFTHAGVFQFENNMELDISEANLTLVNGTFEGTGNMKITNATISGGILTTPLVLVINNATFNLPFVNQTFIRAMGSCSFNETITNEADATFQVLVPSFGGTVVNASEKITNYGTIELTGQLTFQESRLVISDTLYNAVGASINVTEGGAPTPPGDPRTIDIDSTGFFDNYGTLNLIDYNLTINNKGAEIANAGTVNVSGGDLLLNQSGTNPELTSGGIIDISNGQTFEVRNGSFENSNGGIIQGNGTLDISNTNTNFIQSGNINPGTSPGGLTVRGNFLQALDGAVNIEIGGPAGSEFDQLSITEKATFNGTLNIIPINYLPEVGDEFQIINFASRDKNFDIVNGTALGNGLAFETNYAFTNLTLKTISIGPLEVIPLTLDFGEVVETETAFDTVTIKNIGGVDLNVGPFNLSGDNSENFNVDAEQFTLTADSSQVLPISFSPDTIGLLKATLDIVSDSGNVVVNLIGTGFRPQPPDPPGLLFPLSDQTISIGKPTFSFTIPADPNDDSLHFKVEIDDASDFSVGVLTFDSRQSTTGFSPAPPVLQGSGQMSYTLQSPLSDRDWWWRVTAIDELDSMSTSDTRKFAIDTGATPVSQFTRITEGDIANDTAPSTSVTWGDFNNDEYLDLFVTTNSNANSDSNYLYINNDGSSFTKVTTGKIVTDPNFSSASSWGDFDNDGSLDLFVVGDRQLDNLLFQNLGPAFYKFEKLESEIAGQIVSDDGGSLNCSWVDYDRDGFVDMFVANTALQNNFLYRNNGDSSFTKITNVDIVNDLSSSSSGNWGDYNNDGNLDLFVTTEGGAANLFYMNNGDESFSEMTSQVGLRDEGDSESSSWGDYNNDGYLDLFVTFMQPSNSRLYRNDGDGSFTNITGNTPIQNDIGSPRGSAWGDYDNDGALDLFVTYGGDDNNILYRNTGPPSYNFIKVDTLMVGDIAKDIGSSKGCAWGDFDKNGYLDMFVSNFDKNFFYMNNGNGNSWINIKCVGSTSNHSAIGTKVRIKATIGGNSVWQVREISGQTGKGGQNSLNAEFGLGDATIVDSIMVEWPSGTVQEFANVAANRFLPIIESEDPVDLESPLITHSPQETATSGQSLVISTIATDNVGVESATLFYRLGGAISFSFLAMINTDGDTWEGVIPENSVTAKGLEYNFMFVDSTGNDITFPVIDPVNRPQVVRVISSDLTFTSPPFVYRMISMPIDLDNPSPSSVLEDDLGSYDKTEWRLYKSINGSKREFTVDNIGIFEPGAGFWLITRGVKSPDTGPGKSVTTARNFVIDLQPGWNQIGNPFAFPVSWSDVVKNGNIENVLVGYQGSLNENTGYDFTRTQLLPFEGYFVNNLESSTNTLEIPPNAATGVPEHTADLKRLLNLQNDEWALQLTAKSERFLDKDNYIGALQDATNEWDGLDFSEAPFFDNYVSLYFPHLDWQVYPDLYTGDFRSVNSGGHYWDFQIKSNILSSEVILNLEEIANLPPNWEVTLVDKASRISTNFLKKQNYTFLSSPDEAARNFRIIIGRADFVEQNDLGFEDIPENFTLSQNFPNPFNPETRIDYELPENSQVKIQVFNIKGQVIRTLFEGERSAGRYTELWDGRSGSGVALASGIYILRFKSQNFTSVKRMALVK